MMGRKRKENDAAEGAVSTDEERTDAAESETTGEERSEEERLTAEVADLNDRHLRLRAEFDNFRRRSRQDVEVARVAAKRDLLEVLMPAFRSLEQAANAAGTETNIESLREGIDLVLRGLRDALTRQGVSEINPVGEPFDGGAMEAMGMIPSEDVPEGHVAEVFQTGYRVGEHLLHPARVLVSSGPPKAEGENEEKESSE